MDSTIVRKRKKPSKRIPELEKQYGKPIEDITKEYYLDKQYGIVKISKELHLSIKQIYDLLKKANIETRHEFQPSDTQREKITEKIKAKFDEDPTYRQKISDSRKKYYEEHPEAKEQIKKQLEELRIKNTERLKTDEDYKNRQLSGILEGAKKRTKLHKEELYDLYWNQKLSMHEIADRLNVHQSSVQVAMNRYDIQKREASDYIKLFLAKPEVKEKMSKKGKERMDNGYREYLSEIMSGENNPYYGKKHSEETRNKMSNKRQILNESGWKPHNTGKPIREWIPDITQWAKNMHKGLLTFPNKVESVIISIVEKEFKDFIYNGDGKILVIDGLSPDFVDLNNKKIIEVFGEYYHTPDKYKNIFEKDMPLKNSEEYRVTKFKEYGYDTLIIWDHEINNLPEHEIVTKIRKFVNKEI